MGFSPARLIGPVLAAAAVLAFPPAPVHAAGPVHLAARVHAVGPDPSVAGPAGGGSVRVRRAFRAEPSSVGYRAPLPAPLRILRPFAPPATRYGPGHLGVDLAAGGAAVRAAADGVVTFAGPVAGRGVVVIAHPDGIRTEYEPVRPAVRVGSAVLGGDAIGTVSGRHRGCPPGCLHWGARRGSTYLDPLALLHPLGPVRLLPWSPAG